MPYPWRKLAEFGNTHLNNAGNLVEDGRPQWYVDGSVSASLSGLSWDKPLLTIAEAITKASAGDTINVTGEFPISATLALSKELWIIGRNTSPNLYNTMIYTSAAVPIFTITAHMCKIINCGLTQTKAASFVECTSGYKTEIAGCRLDGWGTANAGIESTASGDCPDMTIHHNYFRSIAGNHIESNWTRAYIHDNIMHISAAKVGVNHTPTGGSRPDTRVVNNLIVGANSTDTGIKLVGSPTAGAFIATGNRIFNCSTSITQNANSAAVSDNWYNDGAGGAVIDPIS